MLTQCPECQTVFRATLAQLEAAAGRVRCGQCNTVFDAMESQGEEEEIPILKAPPEAIETAYGSDFETEPEEEPEFEVEVEVDSSTPHTPLDPGDDPLADTAENEILDVEIESTPSIEITMEGERIDIDGEQFAVEADEFAERAREELADLHAEFRRLAQAEPTPEEEEEGAFAAGIALEPLAQSADRGIVLPSGVRVAFDQPAVTDEVPELLVRKPRKRRVWLWTAASMLVALALIAQIVHFNRNALARNALIGGPLVEIYQRLGLPLSPAWDLNAFELRQWGATADPKPGGALRVRASLFNNAEYAQPYPLLRLTLQDRFGGQLGARDLKPEEYLPGTRSGQLLAAGRRIDAEIALVDPGKDAVGFEMDVCLRMDNHKTVCANDPKS